MNFLRTYWIRRKVKALFRRKLGYELNLRSPQTYCEKIQWLKFNNIGRDPRTVERADKYLVRTFVAQQGFEDTLVPLLGCWNGPEEVDWAALPNRFVLKLSNASGRRRRWFVKNKADFAVDDFVAAARSMMARGFGQRAGEFHYGLMTPRLLAEPYLEEPGGGLRDYKFYCFHGKVAFFSVEAGKIEGAATRAYFNPDWSPSHVAFFDDLPPPSEPFRKPPNFARMLHMAEHLSRGYPHLRVDLYNVDGKIYFGELTYAPESGFTRWKPLSLDLEFGRLMNLHDINH